eukprot:352283-Chlamydomonas_euryale.AAC.2
MRARADLVDALRPHLPSRCCRCRASGGGCALAAVTDGGSLVTLDAAQALTPLPQVQAVSGDEWCTGAHHFTLFVTIMV